MSHGGFNDILDMLFKVETVSRFLCLDLRTCQPLINVLIVSDRFVAVLKEACPDHWE